MYSSNQSNVHKKTFFKWSNQSIEENFEIIRAPYKATSDVNGNQVLTIKPEKLKILKNAFNKLDRLKSNEILEDKHIEGLKDVIWELGMQYGDTKTQTRDNLKEYFEKGHTKIVKGKPVLQKGSDLYMDLVHAPNGVMSLSKVLENPNMNIYKSNKKTIDRLASIAHLFDSRHFGSIINITGKQVWPINLPTPLTDFRDSIKNTEELAKIVEERNNDPFFSPGTDIKYSSKYSSILLQALTGSNNYKNYFDVFKLDGFKASDTTSRVDDYDSQSSKTSLIVRLRAFHNNANETYSLIATPTQAGRGTLDFVPIPRVDKLSNLAVLNMDTDTVLKGLILQDLARIKQAHIQIENAVKEGDSLTLKEGYHYKEGSNPYAKDGSVFTMTQIFGLQDSIINGNEIAGTKMSDLVDDYIQGEEHFIHSPEGMRFQ